MDELKKKRKYKKKISSSRKGKKVERGDQNVSIYTKQQHWKERIKIGKTNIREKKGRKTFPSPVSSLLLLLISYLLLNLFTIHHLLLPFPHLVVVIFVVFVVILIFSFFFFLFFVRFLFFFYSIYVYWYSSSSSIYCSSSPSSLSSFATYLPDTLYLSISLFFILSLHYLGYRLLLPPEFCFYLLLHWTDSLRLYLFNSCVPKSLETLRNLLIFIFLILNFEEWRAGQNV